jgi:hypothetical protein
MQDEQQITSGLDAPGVAGIAAFEPPSTRDPRVRYLFCGGDFPYTHTAEYPTGGLWVESPCVTNHICLRCDITPVLLHPTRAQIEYIPEGMAIPGTEVEAGPGPVKLALASYYEYPGPVVTNLLKNYGERGLIELEPLRGFPPATVKSFKLRDVFFPTWPVLPKSNVELIDQLEQKLELCRIAEGFDDMSRRVVVGCGELMLKAVVTYHDWMQANIDETHGRFTLGGEDRDRKRRYDRLDHLALTRTGTARRDNELNLMARQSNDLTKSLKEAVEAIAINARQGTPDSHASEANFTLEQLQTMMSNFTEKIVESIDLRDGQFEQMVNRMTAGLKATGIIDIEDEPKKKRNNKPAEPPASTE